MAKYLPLPDGNSLKVPDSMGYSEAMALAQQQFPDLFGEPGKKAESGFLPAAKAGISSLKSDIATLAARTGIADEAGVEKYLAEQKKYRESTFKPTQTWGEAPVTKGLELLGGSLPYMAAPLAAGVAGAAAPIAGAGTAAAGLASLAQFTGSNLARQIDEGKKLGQTELGAAAAAAVPQAAFDLLSFKMAPGIRQIFAAAGKEVPEKVAEQIAKQGTLQVAKDYGAAAGRAMSVEGLTEAGQQFFERLQAGLTLTDAKARDEYWESLVGGAVLGGALAPAGRYIERGQIAQRQAREQEEQTRKAAAEAEAAKNSPEALAKLDADFRAAQQQLQAFNAKAEAAKTKKGATEEEKAAYQQIKDERASFVNESYKPLKMEFDKRKGLIDKMQLEQQTALETEAAAGQQAAKLPLASDLPGAQPFQLSDTARLMHEHDVMRNQVTALEQQLAAGPDLNTQAQLMQQRGQLMARMQEMAPMIELRGGTTATEAELTKQLAAAEKERLRLLEIGDFDAAAKQAVKVQQMQSRLPHLQELAAFRAQAGQTRELFKPEDLVQPESTAAQQISYVSPKGERIEPFATKAEEASAVEAEKPSLKAPIIDIFDPANVLRTAINSGDTKTINDITAHIDRTTTRKSLDEKAAERETLVKVVESRLDSPGTKRERADLFSKQYDVKQQALFKNGTYPDKELQALYDKGGPAAVEYENIMRQVEDLSKKVTTKQRNAKKSLIEQLIELAKQHEELTAQMESGVATPTMGEKTATLQAKLGKGEAPAARQMDAAERYQLQRKLDAVVQKYRLVEGQVTPVRDQILKLYDSMYTTTPLEKPSKVAATKKAEAEAEARAPKVMSRTARTAARLARGDVRKEAETSQKMRDLALELGQREPGFKKYEADVTKRMNALTERYGDDDPQVQKFRRQVADEYVSKAIEFGRKTPEYKATLKEQIAYFQEVLPTAGKQEVPTKRTGQVTRKQSAAPKTLRVAGSKMSEKEQESIIREAEEPRQARGVEVESPDLTPTQVQHLVDNDLTSALESIANDKNADSVNRAVAQRLAVLLDNTNVVLEDKLVYDGKEVLGSATSKKIELSRSGGLSQEVLLHEGTHAAAERVIVLADQDPGKLTEQQRIAVAELKAIFAKVKDDSGITSANAKSSLSEFVAEVLSNKKLQEQLRQKPWKMSDMLRGLKSIILRMIGIKPADVETMLGASITAIDNILIPSSTKVGINEKTMTRSLSAKDIAALHTGSNSMKQFADQFGDRIKQKDRTPEDVERIANEVIQDMSKNLDKLLSVPTADTLDYKALATMSDGKLYDNDNPLHYVEAEPATHAAVTAMNDSRLRKREAEAIADQRKLDFTSLAQYFSDNYTNYTVAEMALVLKAASKYAVLSGKDGTLRLAEIASNNRHNIAVVGKEGADAVIEELRRGKSLKTAFLDGLQRAADANAKKNARLNGWKKFDQATGDSLEQTAIDLNAGCAGTSWCTGASVNTARGQIEGGDFYVYYKDGKPDVAVRMNGSDKIGEIRGNTPSQALTKEQQQIAESFLRSNNFKNADKFLDERTRRELLAKLFSDPSFNDYKALNALGTFVRNGQLSSYRVESLLDFSAFGGYQRAKPSPAVLEALTQRLNKLVHEAYATNNFIGEDLRFDGDNLAYEFEFDGKKYVANIDTIESANKIYFNPGYDNQALVAPKLREVETMEVGSGQTQAPNLMRVKELTFFGSSYRPTTLTVNPNAVIKEASVYSKKGEVVLNGATTIETFDEPVGDAKVLLPDVKYVYVKLLQGNTLYDDSRQKLMEYIRSSIRDADESTTFGVLREPHKKLSLEAKKAFKQAMRNIASVFGMRNFNVTSEPWFDEDGTPRTLFEKFFDEHAGDYVQADMLAFNKKANEQLKLDTGDTLIETAGTIETPSKIADAPFAQALTETPETPRFAPKDVGVQKDSKGNFSFKRASQPSNSVVGREPGVVDKFLGNIMGLAGRVQFIDQYAALEAATKKGLEAGQISALEATNANYLLRFGQQRSQFAGQFLTNGPVRLEVTKKDGGVESVYRSTGGVSMMNVAEALNKSGVGNDTEQENMFTVYLAGQRAKQVGWNKLNFDNPGKAQAEYDAVMDRLNGDANAKQAFESAAALYQQYNAGLLDFLVQTGALTAKKAAELKQITYVPFYRVKDGEVQLMIDKEHPVRIGNTRDEPQLQELLGGNTAIMPVFASAAQNTFMLTGMGLRNQAVKETAFMLRKLGIASRVTEGKGPANADVVRFKKNGVDHYAVIDTDVYGIPAELIVKGMEGIKTTLPAVVRLMGLPADILRKFVTRNPAYAVRQAIRDPLNAWLTTGTDATPVLSSMKELASMVAGRSEAERKLMETGAISSNVFTGDERDMAKFLKDISAGRSWLDKRIGQLDAFAMQGDAATRAVVYKDSLAKGMTEQQALLRTLESMNFSRRGVSPSMHWLSVMIPFFNAQIQGLDVVYRAFKGDMPYSEQLKIKEKMMARGLMMAAGTLAYAAMMEDDEAYKRAKPEERLANWFVYVPGMKEPLRVPIPFEMGFLFKALPEAVYNTAVGDQKAAKALEGLGKLAMQTIPLSLPQAVKPAVEVYLGKSFFGGDIESEREKQTMATMRYRDNSTELAKLIGSVTGKVSDKANAINIDYLIRGYTGGLGIALVQLANPMLAPDQKAEIAKPSMKPSQTPFIGGLFQPVEGRGTLDEAYDRMMEIRRVKGAYNKLLEEGKQAEAREFVSNYSNDLAAASVAGSIQKRLGELAKQERIVKASPGLTTEQKDTRLERLDQMKVAMARQFLALSDRTTPQ